MLQEPRFLSADQFLANLGLSLPANMRVTELSTVSGDGLTIGGIAFDTVNARVTYENEEYDFTVAAGVTNLFDKFYYLNWFDYQAFGRPNTQAQPGAPQQWYLTVSKRF